jgi:hypothetical protein
VLNENPGFVATGSEVSRVSGSWSRRFSVGNGYIASIDTDRIIDIFGLPGG